MTTVETTGSAPMDSAWTKACALDFLIPNRGVAVLLPGGKQAALFRLPGDRLFAVGNIDPFGRAAVMSRGLVGDRKGEPTVASPLLKQVFSLIDGRCLDDDTKSLPVYDVRVIDGMVEVASMMRTRESSTA
ncbi:nitrite reductase small subunit NirD [Smaragdicoccus niigatensis]|uniref:nitrite reductase small subunit NirD n=1 Tax=Smaragdicoccus niigatensis TaxID=359359 RepID=UPI00058C7134|nr:nitrite reductase small subunit NirD [Smaragdicoccus niigatensis]